MNIDLYTKTVLTVIAVALCVIVFQQGFGSAVALGDGCGSRGQSLLRRNHKYQRHAGKVFLNE